MLKAFLCNKRVYQQQCFSKYYYGSMRNNIRKLMIKKNYNYNGTYTYSEYTVNTHIHIKYTHT